MSGALDVSVAPAAGASPGFLGPGSLARERSIVDARLALLAGAAGCVVD